MKKSDLQYGNVVETRMGDKYFVYHRYPEKALIRLNISEYITLDSYYENLTDINGFIEFDIMKVYKDYTCKELLWERKEEPKLNEDEKAILRNVPKEYKWIARDKNGSIYLYINKPVKRFFGFDDFGTIRLPFDHLFQFIKWEDKEPYSIEELLG